MCSLWTCDLVYAGYYDLVYVGYYDLVSVYELGTS
jgi:hypothetical protein